MSTLIIAFLVLLASIHAEASNYYVNITEKVLGLTSLPFHFTANLLDDSVLLDSDRKWINIYENGGSCLYARCSRDPESCFNVKKYSEVTQEELTPVTNLLQRFLSEDETTEVLEPKYMLLADICGPGQYCNINLNLNGICTNFTAAYVEREALTVGQECTEDMYWKICANGRMKCVDNRCAPVTPDMLCQSSADCWPDKYCNPEGQCVPVKKPGEPCIEQDECGRTAACYFADLRKKQGECVEYFSKMNGESVATYTGHDYVFTDSWNMSILLIIAIK